MKVSIILAVTLLSATLLSGAAEARCWWDGYRTVCVHEGHGYHHGYWRDRERMEKWDDHSRGYWHGHHLHDMYR